MEDVVQPASRILDRLSYERFPLVQYDLVDLVHELFEMSTSWKFLDASLECVGHSRPWAQERDEGRVDVTLERPLLELTLSNTVQLPKEIWRPRWQTWGGDGDDKRTLGVLGERIV